MTTRDIWTQLLEEFPSPPVGPPLDEDVSTTTTIAPAVDTDITNDIATTIYQGIANTPITRNPSLYITPSNGQELWISRNMGTRLTVPFQRVPQILEIHGPEYSIGTTDARRDVNGSATVDTLGQVIQFYSRPEYSYARGRVNVRINYYPYFRAHSGLDGILGYAKTGNAFYAAQVYRSYSEEDFPYLPGVIGEWISVCYCTKFVLRSIGQLRIADFILEFGSVPYLFHANDVPGEISAGRLPGAPTGASAHNVVLVSLPEPNIIAVRRRAGDRTPILIQLPAVVLQSDGEEDTAGDWRYSVLQALPDGITLEADRMLQIIPADLPVFSSRTRVYELNYVALRSSVDTSRPATINAPLTIRVSR